jgi:hypothetical protein
MSVTDMAGLARYHRYSLAGLERLGCPIDSALFAELREAETRLGPPERQEFFSAGRFVGTRRSGFESMRDIITRYRRAWADRNLDSYLQKIWETEIQEAARLHSKSTAERGGRPPTPKQFARHAAAATNHWFGGDLSAFYAAIGEKSPIQPVKGSIMPADQLGFMQRVFERLAGRPFERLVYSSAKDPAGAEELRKSERLRYLANQSLAFIQLYEALGRPPDLRDVQSWFENRKDILSPDPQAAWDNYVAVVETVRCDP